MKQIKRFHWAGRAPVAGSTLRFDKQRKEEGKAKARR